MNTYKNVNVNKLANIYFEGKVISRNITFNDHTIKTLGVMLPGEYEFKTQSKELMEKFLIEKINNNANITIIRPPWFYGENMPERQKLFYQMIISGKFPIIGDGMNVRSLANVKNICQGIFLASIKQISKGKIYWIADEKPYSMNQKYEIFFTGSYLHAINDNLATCCIFNINY